MPGVPGPGPDMAAALEERLSQALQELRAVAEAGRVAVTQAADAAMATLEPVAQAADELRAETVALNRRLDALSRQVEVLSLRLGVPLVPDLEPELEPSEQLLAAADPEALFQAAEGAVTPVAHPPAFSTRRRSSAGPTRNSGLVSSPACGRGWIIQARPCFCLGNFSEPQFTCLRRGLGHWYSKPGTAGCQALALRRAWPLPLAWPSPQPHPRAPTPARPSLPETAATLALLHFDREALPGEEGLELLGWGLTSASGAGEMPWWGVGSTRREGGTEGSLCEVLTHDSPSQTPG